MKTIYLGVIAAMFALLTVSCNKEENQPTVPATFSYSFSFALDQATLDMFDVTLNYFDEKGSPKTEALTTTSEVKTVNGRPKIVKPSVSKEIKAASIPYVGGHKLTFKFKNNVPDQPKYEVTIIFIEGYSYQPEVGAPVIKQLVENIDHVGGNTREEILTYLNATTESNICKTYKVEKNRGESSFSGNIFPSVN